MLRALARDRPFARITAGALALFAVLAALAAVRVADWSYGADTGTFVQIVANAGTGMWNGVERTTHLAFHWSPVLAVLWPLIALAPADGPLILQLVLAAAAAACVPLVFLIARPRVGPALAERAAWVTAVYPPLLGIGFGEFRDLGLLPPLALGWWLALERRAWVATGALALVLAGLREDVCLELALLGAALGALALRRGDRPRAVALAGSAALAVLCAAVYVVLILPHVGGWRPSHFYVYPFAAGPLALVVAAFIRPAAVAGAIATLGRLTYVLEALVPLAFVPLRSPLALLALPGAAIVLLANSADVWRMGMHYVALWLPWLLIAFVDALARLRAPLRWTTAAVALCIVTLLVADPLHPAHYLRPSYHDLADARAALAAVPAGASVETVDEWYSAIAGSHPKAMIFGSRPTAAGYLVFAEDDPDAAFRAVLPAVRALIRTVPYRLALRRGAVVVYVRVRKDR